MDEIFNEELIHTKSITITVHSVILFVFIMLSLYLVIKIFTIFVTKKLGGRSRIDARKRSILQLINYFLWTLGCVFGLQALGVDITFLVASSAALLVGLGLGLQIIFKDIVSGIILLIEGTIKVDDIVEIEGQVLKVTEISIRTSRVITRDDIIIIIPNHKFVEENVINWTHEHEPTRFKIDIGVDYSSDLDLVRATLMDCITRHPDVIKDEKHEPFVRFNQFGASAIELHLVFWSDNLFRIDTTKSELRFMIAEAFKKRNIVIAFNQMVIHQADKASSF
jgi:small-conductance mechanosensitive channel